MRVKVLLSLALILVFCRAVEPRSLLLWALCGYGLTFLAKDATVLARPRDWCTARSPFLKAMLECSYCTGFHVGWMLSVALLALVNQPFTPLLSLMEPHLRNVGGAPWFFRALAGVWLDGVWFAITSYLLDTLALWLESGTDEDPS